MSKVQRQHYVWRHYLRPWSQDEHIWTYFKTSRKVEYPELMGVAQQRYFYKLVDFTPEEELLLKEFINNTGHPMIRELNLTFLALFTSTTKLKQHLKISPIANKATFEEEISVLETNLMEEAYGKIEAMGMKLVNYRTDDDLKSIFEDDYHFDAIMFLCFQYFRTKKMRKNYQKNFTGKKYEEFVKKASNIISYTLATTLARSISVDSRLRFNFIENNTSVDFITSDQPVFNILGDELNENGDVKVLEFYYPLTPKIALLLHFRDSQTEDTTRVIADHKMVDTYNNKMLENADFFVFANSKEQLEEIAQRKTAG